jgi:O-antigen ligase
MPVIQNVEASPYGAVWHNGYVAWHSAPIMGVGMSNFVPMCEKLGRSAGFRNELPEWKELRCVRHPHNIYLEWAAELGLIGLAFFIGLIIFWVRHIKRNMPDPDQDAGLYYMWLGSAIGLIAFLWPLMASLSFFSNWSAVLFWWVLGMAVSNPKLRQ